MKRWEVYISDSLHSQAVGWGGIYDMKNEKKAMMVGAGSLKCANNFVYT